MNIKANAVALAMFCVSGCASNQHLVFFTNTTIGVEIGSEPANGSPAKFIVGYKRQEGVIDPLIPDYEFIPNSGGTDAPADTLDTFTSPENGDTNIILTPQGTAIPKGQNNKAHSVLAKMNFGATGGGSGASAAQFFATGRAAELLAESESIAGALAGDPKVNVKQTANLDALGSGNYAYLHYVYRILTDYIAVGSAKSGDALTIKNQVDTLDKGDFRKPIREYAKPQAAGSAYTIIQFQSTNGQSFRKALTLIKKMNDSLGIAKKMVIDNSATVSGAALTNAQKQDLVTDISSYPQTIEKAESSISTNQSVVRMIDFVHKNILLSNN